MKDFSVAAALINAFHHLIEDRNDAGEILTLINQKMYSRNSLSTVVINNNLNRRRTNFQQINVDDNNVSDFPRLHYNELILVSLGTYQIKQARSYYSEHIRANGSFTIEVCREVDSSLLRELSTENSVWLLKGKIQSRHVGRKIYFVLFIFWSTALLTVGTQYYNTIAIVM
ncbi:hypothetical protein PYW07_000283 [Mythimna separata]|uniref:Uncharacterized protein n=1 Tax=Mythimna separata TaxID=271217 RepID=A0AAD7Z1V7_MYTSE|nr:hypothetical protein PYW07_000283 [Mythimna separata]